VVLHFLIAEPQYANAVCLQEFGPLCVTRGLCRVDVNAAIHFDYELMLDTEDIEDKMTVRMLPPELEPGKTAAS